MNDTDPPAAIDLAPPTHPPLLADPLLYLLAESLTDLERTRIAAENRLRQLTRDVDDTDGERRGFGLGLDIPAVAAQAAIVDALVDAEHRAILSLQARLREHPLGPWVAAAKGVGAKQGARLIACIGDPYWNTLHDRPRTVGELWAYCGYKPGQRRKKGERANWSSDAKMRAYLVAESCMKSRKRSCVTEEGETKHVTGCECSPYRIVYDEARAQYAEALHSDDCFRCGPKGRPALAGSPLSDGHKMARALRKAAKQVLKDLWLEGRRLSN